MVFVWTHPISVGRTRRELSFAALWLTWMLTP